MQMRIDLIKDLADPLNKRIDDLTAQHHGLSHRVAQLEGRPTRDRPMKPVAVRIAEKLCGLMSARSNALFPLALTRLRASTIMEFDLIARLETRSHRRVQPMLTSTRGEDVPRRLH